MKKLLLSILIILLCLSAFVLIACNGDDSTTTGDITTTVPPTDGKFSSKTDVKRDWEGKTLNIACSTYSAQPSAPWSVLELCVDYGKESGFGTKIDTAVLERQEFIKETYGVDLNWINATRYGMHDALEIAISSGNVYYDLALPRAMRVQSIVAGGYIYDLANREYIDFDNSYYSQNSVDTYTAKGHTFFVDGDFSNISEETAKVLYFNKTLLGGEQAAKDLYRKVRENKWTYDELVSLAIAAYKDDGDGMHDDNDTYGLKMSSITDYYSFFGVKQAGVNSETGEWMIAFNDPKINDVISIILTSFNANWTWHQLTYSPIEKEALLGNRLLFLSDFMQYAESYTVNGNVGVIPFPMLDTEQGRYCVPCVNSMIVLMCIPKNTQDRAMSEYFLDVLSWTGKEYTVKAYLDTKSEYVSDEDMEMLTDYIFPNITYDAGAAIGWGSLMGEALTDSYKGSVNNFDNAYAKHEPKALKTIKNWNTAWGAYTED